MSRHTEDISDEALLAMAARGDAKAFEVIYDRHAAGVARALCSYAGADSHTVDDLTQDVFCRVIDNISFYTPNRPFSHWLYTIALNVGRNHVRRQSKVVVLDPLEQESI